VDLSAVTERYAEVAFRVRDLGIAFSDRRAVKGLKLVAASAVLCGRQRALASDLWVLRYVWDREEQIEPLASLIHGVLEQAPPEPDAHILAALPERADAEALARQLAELEQEMKNGERSLLALARLRERVGGLVDRAAWVADESARKHLLHQAKRLLEQLG
jgi:MoxR-like ATPase